MFTTTPHVIRIQMKGFNIQCTPNNQNNKIKENLLDGITDV